MVEMKKIMLMLTHSKLIISLEKTVVDVTIHNLTLVHIFTLMIKLYNVITQNVQTHIVVYINVN